LRLKVSIKVILYNTGMKKYVFKPYLTIFPDLYKKEEARIKKILDKDDLIEHFGSTAVPGLGGKGIIDIYIATKKNRMKALSEELQKLGYEYRPQAVSEERLFHKISLPDPVEGERVYRVHVAFIKNKDWVNAIKLRDYLRKHPADAQKYAKVKKIAAKKAKEEREIYIQIKGPVLEEILEKALK